MSYHTDDPICPGCETMLVHVNSKLAQWFRDKVKSRHGNCHISCGWRDQADQNQAFADGKSKLQWPHSQHNVVDDMGQPQSRALDLFNLENGVATYPFTFYNSIWQNVKYDGDLIKWGGTFTNFKDEPHFEMVGQVPPTQPG